MLRPLGTTPSHAPGGVCQNCKQAAPIARGLCRACYNYQRRTGQARPVPQPWRAHCSNCAADSGGFELCVDCLIAQFNPAEFEVRRRSLVCECGRPAEPVSVQACGPFYERYFLTIPVCTICRADMEEVS